MRKLSGGLLQEEKVGGRLDEECIVSPGLESDAGPPDPARTPGIMAPSFSSERELEPPEPA